MALTPAVVSNTQDHMLRQISAHWGDRLLSLSFIAIGLLLVLLAISGLRAWQLHRTRHQRERPVATFLTVARSLDLTWSQIGMLMCIARHARLPSALTLLLSGATLRHHACQYGQSIARFRRARLMACVVDLRRTLFKR